MSEKNKAILTKANAAVSKGEYESFLENCTDDTKWTFIGNTVLNGKSAVRKWMTESYVKPPKVIVDDLIAEGKFLTAVGTVSMINKDGEWENFWYCDVWKFRDGRMAELRAFVIKKD